jgi:hypothetical protein
MNTLTQLARLTQHQELDRDLLAWHEGLMRCLEIGRFRYQSRPIRVTPPPQFIDVVEAG